MKSKTTTFKKRHILYGLIALEIAAIPVSAKIIKDVAFAEPEQTLAVPFPEQPGLAKFLVSSNVPFAIISENGTGEFDVRIDVSGDLNGNHYGKNAQLPGAPESCASTLTASPTTIYQADRKIDAAKGDVLSRAIIVEIHYAADIKPDFTFVPQKDAKKLASAPACEITLT